MKQDTSRPQQKRGHHPPSSMPHAPPRYPRIETLLVFLGDEPSQVHDACRSLGLTEISVDMRRVVGRAEP